MREERIIYIDYLKVMGLLLVILAHVDCPKYIMQIRSFDVPLLVVLSGYLASKTLKKGNNKKYYWKRIQRLAIPSWIFLIVFWGVQTLVYIKPSFIDMIKAITFQRDANMVGMLWVIWVYLICALLIPLIYRIGYSLKNNVVIILIFMIYEIICMMTNLSTSRLVYITVFTIIPWGMLTYFSFYLDKITNRQKIIIIITGLIFFILYAIALNVKNGTFVTTNNYKYPARLYYFVYAIPIVILLIELLKKVQLKSNSLISFISSSSLWIYLWHILVLYVVKRIIVNDKLWIIQYFAIVVIASIVTYIQNGIAKYLITKYKIQFLKILLG